MESIRKVVVEPGISEAEMKAVWVEAVNSVRGKPGAVKAILFAPGSYPLPDSGTYVYKEIGTMLHVSSPGSEVLFAGTDNGGLTITVNRISRRRRA